jgi:hypothetical protein
MAMDKCTAGLGGGNPDLENEVDIVEIVEKSRRRQD